MFTVLVPARYASTRLPGKPLADIAGKPMVVRVADRAREVPVLADIELETYGLDPAAVAAAITPATRAILAVHYGGQLCRIEELAALAQKHRVSLIEDAAHSPGARHAFTDGAAALYNPPRSPGFRSPVFP